MSGRELEAGTEGDKGMATDGQREYYRPRPEPQEKCLLCASPTLWTLPSLCVPPGSTTRPGVVE